MTELSFRYKIDPKEYTKKYYLSENYAGSKQFKEGSSTLAPSVDHIYKKIKKNSGSIKRFLDAGCGKGELIKFMSLKKYISYGVDYSEDAINIAKNFLKSENVKAKVVRADIRDLPYKDSFFDCIISTDVIEHLDDEKAAIDFVNEMYRILKPNGKFYLHTSPNKYYVEFFVKYYQRFINSIIFKVIGLIKGIKIIYPLDIRSDYEKRFHINEQTYISLNNIFKKTKFSNYKIEMFSDPFTFSIFKIPYYIVAYLFPINKIFPLNIILGNHLYAKAKK